MDRERVILHIASMLRLLEDGQIRAVYMVVKELLLVQKKKDEMEVSI